MIVPPICFIITAAIPMGIVFIAGWMLQTILDDRERDSLIEQNRRRAVSRKLDLS